MPKMGRCQTNKLPEFKRIRTLLEKFSGCQAKSCMNLNELGHFWINFRNSRNNFPKIVSRGGGDNKLKCQNAKMENPETTSPPLHMSGNQLLCINVQYSEGWECSQPASFLCEGNGNFFDSLVLLMSKWPLKVRIKLHNRNVCFQDTYQRLRQIITWQRVWAKEEYLEDGQKGQKT